MMVKIMRFVAGMLLMGTGGTIVRIGYGQADVNSLIVGLGLVISGLAGYIIGFVFMDGEK